MTDADTVAHDNKVAEKRGVTFQRVSIGGLPIAVLDREQTARLTISAALSRRGSNRPCLFFTTANGQGISLCASNANVRGLFQQADVISADGMSVVFASRLLRGPTLPERVATTDAFHDAARVAEETGATFYLFGATEDENAKATARARKLYPNLEIVGSRHGYFTPQEEPGIVDEINSCAPDVLWIGLGVPHQQRFICNNRKRLTKVGLAKTCGGLFDFLAGKNKRAPAWAQAAGLEWAFRASQEPTRLAWRYVKTNPHAAYFMLFRSGDFADEGFVDADVVI
jgi:N-acetylglucosaminyldiphosphoundecaprenol N-acetyl-beta-D-mannosaminyltransferase